MHALRGIDLEIHKGEVVMIVGPSGCGKTTLLFVIGGLLSPTAGQITVFGQDVAAMDEGALQTYRQHTVGFVFQGFNLVPTLTVLKNVIVPLLAGRGVGPAIDRGRMLLTEAELSGRDESFPAQLSGGEKHRVAIARGMANDPPLLLCDEPTARWMVRPGTPPWSG
ncbi:ABC transporter ATP-binding protein [Sulfurivirga caldicuralii]|uniref:ABC transporter ATP-binding protein n=1 Tax=Sulfurivirga caldicuralii TaxID=364032 RepID=UPI001F23D5B1|nr:ATP-binding cassette domain-containing protein [Sulfurivirga caldicuralii]